MKGGEPAVDILVGGACDANGAEDMRSADIVPHMAHEGECEERRASVEVQSVTALPFFSGDH